MLSIRVDVYHHWCAPSSAPPRPQGLAVVEKRQINMAQFGFKVALPIMGVSDIVHRELTITKNGEEPPEVKVYDKVTLTDELVYDAGDSLVFVLVDIDSAGNRSPQSAAFVYEVTDTIPPPQPGNLGVVELRQIG